MRKIFTVLVISAFAVSCNNTEGGSSAASSKVVSGKLSNDDQKASYAYGMSIASQVKQQFEMMGDNLSSGDLEKGVNDYMKMAEDKRNSYAVGQNIGQSIDNFIESQNLKGKIEPSLVIQGLADALNDKTTLFPEDSIMSFMDDYMMKLAMAKDTEGAAQKAVNEEIGIKFMDEKRNDSNVKFTASGLAYEVIQEGQGESPTIESIVKVNYVGKNIDGTIFDESKGNPIEFPLGGVIQGWQEGLQLMKPGAKYKFYIPANLAYGDRGAPGGKIQPGATLEFEVELIEVQNR